LAQGMGREVAKRIAAAGDTVAGFDIDRQGIETLRAEFENDGHEALLHTLDVCDRPGIARFRDEVLERYGHVDTVLANVGIGFFGPFEEVDLDSAARCLEINVIGTAAVLQAFVGQMREQRSGKLIAVSSLVGQVPFPVGQVPFPFESIYAATKFAVEGLVLSLRYEVEPFGIRVALIHPAQVSTNFAAKIHVLPDEGSPYRERVRRFIARDEKLIQTAIDPATAADRIVEAVRSPAPPLFNPLDSKSRFFMMLNRFLPMRLRDELLLRQMDIR